MMREVPAWIEVVGIIRHGSSIKLYWGHIKIRVKCKGKNVKDG